MTVSASADLDPSSKFFSTGEVDKIVYVPTSAVAKTTQSVGQVSTVVDAGATVDLGFILEDLANRGVKRLMVEGGGTMHTQFLSADLADEIHLVIAPFFVGDGSAPRFVGDAAFPQGPAHRMNLAEVKQIGDVVLLRYLPRSTSHVEA
ncbi:RibD family protein [Kribbella sp. NPDC002412]